MHRRLRGVVDYQVVSRAWTMQDEQFVVMTDHKRLREGGSVVRRGDHWGRGEGVCQRGLGGSDDRRGERYRQRYRQG